MKYRIEVVEKDSGTLYYPQVGKEEQTSFAVFESGETLDVPETKWYYIQPRIGIFENTWYTLEDYGHPSMGVLSKELAEQVIMRYKDYISSSNGEKGSYIEVAL